ncbi:hypothetical protein HYH03_001197 [Edaphochlamys debaryana]|uniref:Uncharacterized protein n=1 Tax=Edaphochlamys debaryana TaxID=47281 RepID=A0A836C6Y6_9CHLO|nr:hypothetical protein HYH03_001197 [Edaphochlamys debaryana]|eukprot:KAG2501414.1 hypothetical protein HYH03_001197 [Edaphochlamys debaryana]
MAMMRKLSSAYSYSDPRQRSRFAPETVTSSQNADTRLPLGPAASLNAQQEPSPYSANQHPAFGGSGSDLRPGRGDRDGWQPWSSPWIEISAAAVAASSSGRREAAAGGAAGASWGAASGTGGTASHHPPAPVAPSTDMQPWWAAFGGDRSAPDAVPFPGTATGSTADHVSRAPSYSSSHCAPAPAPQSYGVYDAAVPYAPYLTYGYGHGEAPMYGMTPAMQHAMQYGTQYDMRYDTDPRHMEQYEHKPRRSRRGPGTGLPSASSAAPGGSSVAPPAPAPIPASDGPDPGPGFSYQYHSGLLPESGYGAGAGAGAGARGCSGADPCDRLSTVPLHELSRGLQRALRRAWPGLSAEAMVAMAPPPYKTQLDILILTTGPHRAWRAQVEAAWEAKLQRALRT